jgi:hypothetical protein
MELYTCPVCAHACTKAEMQGDYAGANMFEEVWCNTVCPQCGAWNDINRDWKQTTVTETNTYTVKASPDHFDDGPPY